MNKPTRLPGEEDESEMSLRARDLADIGLQAALGRTREAEGLSKDMPIDKMLDDHDGLVRTYMQTVATQMAALTIAKAIAEAADMITCAIEDLRKK
jgi:hypothetical protein